MTGVNRDELIVVPQISRDGTVNSGAAAFAYGRTQDTQTGGGPFAAGYPAVSRTPIGATENYPSVFNAPAGIERTGQDPFVTSAQPSLQEYLRQETLDPRQPSRAGELVAQGLPDPAVASPAQEAAGALGAVGNRPPASPIPAALGGGSSGFATGNNCSGCASSGGPITAPQSGIAPGPAAPYMPGASEQELITALDNDPEFQAELDRITSTYGITREEVYGIIAGESSYRADLFSPGGGYGGLFQLGTGTMGLDDSYTSAVVASLSPAEQIRLYGSVLDYHAGRGWTASQGLGILQGAPALSGWAANRDLGEWVSPSGDRPYAVGGRYWAVNPGWRGPDGRITPNSMNTYYSRRNPPAN